MEICRHAIQKKIKAQKEDSSGALKKEKKEKKKKEKEKKQEKESKLIVKSNINLVHQLLIYFLVLRHTKKRLFEFYFSFKFIHNLVKKKIVESDEDEGSGAEESKG